MYRTFLPGKDIVRYTVRAADGLRRTQARVPQNGVVVKEPGSGPFVGVVWNTEPTKVVSVKRENIVLDEPATKAWLEQHPNGHIPRAE